MNYEKVYFSLMLKASSREKPKGYCEKHHWYPKSLFPEYKSSKWNIVFLTAREHFVAHKLLTKMLPKSKPMKRAFSAMCQGNKTNRNLKITSRDFNKSREILINVAKENFSNKRPRHMIGRTGHLANRKKLANIYKNNVLIAKNVVITDWCRKNKLESQRSNLCKTAIGKRNSAKGFRAEYTNLEV